MQILLGHFMVLEIPKFKTYFLLEIRMQRFYNEVAIITSIMD